MSSPDTQFEEVDLATPAATAAVRCYFAELSRRFATGFDPVAYATSSAVADQQQRFLLATRDGRRSAAVCSDRWTTGSPRSSGCGWTPAHGGRLGLGRRLLAELANLAVRIGCQLIRLDTNGTLTEAIGRYERQDHRRIPRYHDNPYAQVWFEKVLD